MTALVDLGCSQKLIQANLVESSKPDFFPQAGGEEVEGEPPLETLLKGKVCEGACLPHLVCQGLTLLCGPRDMLQLET